MFYRLSLAVLAILSWLALAIQLYIIIRYRSSTVGATLVQYFSYYTILTNIMIGWICTVLFINREDTSKRKSILTAILVYILTVGVTYNIILRSLWKPEGLQFLADNLLHSIIPFLYLFFWLIFVKKHTLEWKDALPWLIYPCVYLIYLLIRGAIFGLYPYPFIDVSQLGYQRALLNAFSVSGVILFFSLLSVGVTKISKK